MEARMEPNFQPMRSICHVQGVSPVGRRGIGTRCSAAPAGAGLVGRHRATDRIVLHVSVRRSRRWRSDRVLQVDGAVRRGHARGSGACCCSEGQAEGRCCQAIGALQGESTACGCRGSALQGRVVKLHGSNCPELARSGQIDIDVEGARGGRRVRGQSGDS